MLLGFHNNHTLIHKYTGTYHQGIHQFMDGSWWSLWNIEKYLHWGYSPGLFSNARNFPPKNKFSYIVHSKSAFLTGREEKENVSACDYYFQVGPPFQKPTMSSCYSWRQMIVNDLDHWSMGNMTTSPRFSPIYSVRPAFLHLHLHLRLHLHPLAPHHPWHLVKAFRGGLSQWLCPC